MLQLIDRNDPFAELVARKIIDIAEVGETDPDLAGVHLTLLGLGGEADVARQDGFVSSRGNRNDARPMAVPVGRFIAYCNARRVLN